MAIERHVYSDLPIPPGEYFAEVLKEKGISQAEIARRMGRPAQAINEIISGEKAITPETAIQLEHALGVPAHIWSGLEARYRLIKARQFESKQLQKDLSFLSEIPYKEIAQLGFVKKTRDKLEKVRELHRFFGVSAMANMTSVKAYAPAFRCARRNDASPYALAAWLKCAEIFAQEKEMNPFNKDRLCSCMARVRQFTLESPPEFISDLKKTLTDCGVALVLMPHFPKTYAHGAAFWQTQNKAVVALSIRGSWADIFWFSLFHELAHILLHKRLQIFIDSDEIDNEMQDLEKEADRFAADQLIPKDFYQQYIKSSLFTAESVRAFASQTGIAPGIMVGRLQHDGLLRQDSRLNSLRERLKWNLEN